MKPTEKFTKEKLHSLILGETSIQGMLTSHRVTPQVFASKVVATVFDNEKLTQCTPESIMKCIIKSAQLGLPVDAHGFAYLVPRKNNGIQEATFQIGYRGYISLAKRNPEVLSITCDVVYKDDYFDVIKGSEEKIVHKPNYDGIRKDGDIRLAYSIIKYKNGGEEWEIMPKAEIDKAKSTNTASTMAGSAWANWYNEMAKKTAIRRLLKKCHFMEVEEGIDADDDEQFKDVTPKASVNVDLLANDYKPQHQNAPKDITDEAKKEEKASVSAIIAVSLKVEEKEAQASVRGLGFQFKSEDKTWKLKTTDPESVRNKLIAMGIGEEKIEIIQG